MGRYRKPGLGSNLQPPTPASFRCPSWMDEDGRRLWRQLAPILIKEGVITVLDRPAFELLCATFGQMKQVERETRNAPPLVSDGRGGQKKNPIYTIQKQQIDQFTRLAKDFGLTPVSRGRISINPNSLEDDPVNEFFETSSKIADIRKAKK